MSLISRVLYSVLFLSPILSSVAQSNFTDQFTGTSLGAGWTLTDGYAVDFPEDTAHHATFQMTGSQLAIAIPGGREHNMWWLRHAKVTRSYRGSGSYEVKVDGGVNGTHQFGFVFQRDSRNFLIFMLYATDKIRAYIERFTWVDGEQLKTTFGTEPIAVPLPDAGPYYLRTDVEENAGPATRQWKFQWSRDGVVWQDLFSGIFEGNAPAENIGQLQQAGFFVGNHPPTFDPVYKAFDYFRYAVLPAPTNVIARPGNQRVDLAWSPVPRADRYSISISLGGSYFTLGTTTGTTFSQTGLQNGTKYSFIVTPTLNGVAGMASTPVAAVPHVPAGAQTLPSQGLQLALSASELAYVLSSGQPVADWPNAAGPFTAATAPQARAPQFITSAINGRPAVRFDGNDDFMALPSGFSDFTAGLTLFVVLRPATLQPGSKIVQFGNGPGVANIGLSRAGATAGYQYFNSNSAGTFDWFDTLGGLVANEASLIAVRQQPGSAGGLSYAEIFKNGAQLFGKQMNVPHVASRNLNYIARSYWADGLFHGDIAEIILYNRVLSTAEQNAVQTYIGQRYGLNLGSMPPPPLLPAPTNLLASAGNATVVLGWSPVGAATGYKVYRTSTAGGVPMQIADVTSTGYTDTTVLNGTTYHYVVSAYNATSGSPFSVQVSATPVAPPPPPAGIPTAGLILSLNAESLLPFVAYGQPVLTWPDASSQRNNALSGPGAPVLVSNAIGGRPAVRFDGVDDSLTLPSGFQDFTSGMTLFIVQRPAASSAGAKILMLSNGPGSANIGFARAASAAGYQYFTTNGAGSFEWFDTPSGMLVNEASLLAVRQQPGAANGLSFAEIFKNGVQLHGKNVYVPPVVARGFNYIARSSWSSDALFQGDIADIILYNRVLTPAEQDSVHIYISQRYGLSLASMPPPPLLPAPTNLLANAGNAGVILGWSPVAGATGYKVYRASTSGGTPVQIADTAGTSYTDTGVSNGTTYYYVVSAYNATSGSPYSTQVAATPIAPPQPPPGLPTTGLLLSLNAESLVPLVANGQPVMVWPDASPLRSNAIAGSGAPTFVSSAIAGRPAVRFDGVDDFLSLASGFQDLTGGISLFVVLRPSALTNGSKIVMLGNGAGSLNIGLGRAGSTSGYQYLVTNTSGNFDWFDSTSGMVANETSLLSLRQQAGAANALAYAEIFKNGTPLAGKNVYVPPVGARGFNYIAKSYWSDGLFQGDIAEVILYNRVLNSTEQAAVHAYISQRYGLSLAGMPPPPTLAAPTNVTANGGNATVSLSWSPVTSATGYRVYRSGTAGGSPVEIGTTSTTAYTDTTVLNGSTYYYTVSAFNATAVSPQSTQVSAQPSAPPQPPAGIPTAGLLLSLNAESLVPLVANGQPVVSWPDASPSRNNAVAAGSAAPVLVSSAIGGRPGVRFDGVDDFLTLGAGFQNFTSGITLFVVLRPTVLKTGSKILLLGNGAGAANVGLGRAGATAGYQYLTNNSSGTFEWFDTGNGMVANETSLLALRQQPGAENSLSSAAVFKNGTQLGGKNVYVPPVTSRGTNYIGRSYWSDGPFQGDIAEIILYNRVLTTSEQNAVHGYIGQRYGITLTNMPP